MIKKIVSVVGRARVKRDNPVVSNHIQSGYDLKPITYTTRNINKNINDAFKGWLIFYTKINMRISRTGGGEYTFQ